MAAVRLTDEESVAARLTDLRVLSLIEAYESLHLWVRMPYRIGNDMLLNTIELAAGKYNRGTCSTAGATKMIFIFGIHSGIITCDDTGLKQ